MKTQKRGLIILFLLPFFLFFSPDEEESHGSSLVGYLGKILNFLVLFGGLGYLLRKPLLNFLERRGLDIDTSIKDAEQEQAETEKKYKQAVARLQELKKELEIIRRDAEEEGQKRKLSILDSAERETERIKNFTRQEIEMFYQTKISELKAYTADLSTGLAESNIKAKMTPEKQSVLIDLAIDKLEGFYDK